jgi:uncharacterized protein YndB with AHSA1/START domain
MIKFRSEATIARPVDDVRKFLATTDRYGEWMPVSNVHMVKGTSDQAGSVVSMAMGGPGGKRYDMEFEVAEATPRKYVWRTLKGGPLRGEYRAELEPVNTNSTRVVYSGEVALTGLWRLMTPFVARELQNGEASELKKMKQLLEAQ